MIGNQPKLHMVDMVDEYGLDVYGHCGSVDCHRSALDVTSQYCFTES